MFPSKIPFYASSSTSSSLEAFRRTKTKFDRTDATFAAAATAAEKRDPISVLFNFLSFHYSSLYKCSVYIVVICLNKFLLLLENMSYRCTFSLENIRECGHC